MPKNSNFSFFLMPSTPIRHSTNLRKPNALEGRTETIHLSLSQGLLTNTFLHRLRGQPVSQSPTTNTEIPITRNPLYTNALKSTTYSTIHYSSPVINATSTLPQSASLTNSTELGEYKWLRNTKGEKKKKSLWMPTQVRNPNPQSRSMKRHTQTTNLSVVNLTLNPLRDID